MAAQLRPKFDPRTRGDPRPPRVPVTPVLIPVERERDAGCQCRPPCCRPLEGVMRKSSNSLQRAKNRSLTV